MTGCGSGSPQGTEAGHGWYSTGGQWSVPELWGCGAEGCGHGRWLGFGVLEVFSSLNGAVTLQCCAPAEHSVGDPSARFALGSYR